MHDPVRTHPSPSCSADVVEYMTGCRPWLKSESGLVKFTMLNLTLAESLGPLPGGCVFDTAKKNHCGGVWGRDQKRGERLSSSAG